MVDFAPVFGLVPMIAQGLLHNHDVKVLYLLCRLVMLGPSADENLKISHVKPGKVCPSRWFTTASSILALYIQTPNPSANLKLLVGFILNVYAPCLFMIKNEWQCFKGPIHFYNLLAFSRDFFGDQKDSKGHKYLDIVTKVLRNNSYWIHPENVILAMVMGDSTKLHGEGLKIIQKLRKSKAKRIRQFVKPKFINFDAQSFEELIDFKMYKPSLYCSPPLLRNHSLQAIKTKDFDPDILEIPAHSQHVERYVYLTSLASQSVIGQEERDAYVLNKVTSSQKISAKSTKQEFLALMKE